MEDLSVAGKATTEEIIQLKVDLGWEVVAHSSREEELGQLTGELEKKGLELLKKNSKL